MQQHLRLLISLLAAATFLGGCAIPLGPKAHKDGPILLSPTALDDLTTAYADRYVLLISAATDSIKARTPNIVARHRAQKLKTESAVSVYDIVTTGDAYTRLLDLTVAVTLQSEVYIDEDEAEHIYGKEYAPQLIRAMRQARVEIWEIAARALSQEQLDNLDVMIWQFRRSNPTLPNVINVRFNDFKNSSNKVFITDASFGLFSQLDEARQTVDEARRLAERAFFYGKRAPLLLSWQAETTSDEMLAKPELVQALSDIHQFGNLAEGLPAIVAREREAILAAFDDRQKALNDGLGSVRQTLAQADDTIKSAQATLQELQRTTAAINTLLTTADAVASKYVPPPSTQPATTQSAQIASSTTSTTTAPATTAPHPFDIREYTEALTHATAAAHELNDILASSNSLIASPALTARIDELKHTADDRIRIARGQSDALVSSIFKRVYISIGILFLALVAYRLVSITITRRMLRADSHKSHS